MVPRLELYDTLHWTNSECNPCCAKSRAQKERAKNPRLSSSSSDPMTYTPEGLVSMKCICRGDGPSNFHGDSVQKKWSSSCWVRMRYSSCFRRVNVRYSKTSFVMSIRLNRS